MIRYPIYHIPAHGNLKGISACFLAYHSISSVFQGIYIHPLSHTLSNLYDLVIHVYLCKPWIVHKWLVVIFAKKKVTSSKWNAAFANADKPLQITYTAADQNATVARPPRSRRSGWRHTGWTATCGGGQDPRTPGGCPCFTGRHPPGWSRSGRTTLTSPSSHLTTDDTNTNLHWLNMNKCVLTAFHWMIVRRCVLPGPSCRICYNSMHMNWIFILLVLSELARDTPYKLFKWDWLCRYIILSLLFFDGQWCSRNKAFLK
jgi:hypothetical protein